MQLFLKNFLPGIGWMVLVFVLTLAPGNYIPKVGNFLSLFSPDKLIHLFIFSVLAYLLLSGSVKQYSAITSRYKIIVPMAVALFTGVVTEILQANLPIGREASIYDSIANFAGSFIGYYSFSGLKNKNWKLFRMNKKNN